MKQKITFEKDRKLSRIGQIRIIKVLRKEGARKIEIREIDIFVEEGPDKSSGEKDGENDKRSKKAT